MNIQPEIKSHCQELLKEQEMNRRQIRALISRAAFAMGDLTRCLKPWGWTYTCFSGIDKWSKTFDLPYSLLSIRFRRVRLWRKITVRLTFSAYFIDLQIEPDPMCEAPRYLNTYHSPYDLMLNLNLKTSLALQKFATELPKIIASAKTKLIYRKRQKIEVIPYSVLTVKMEHVFEEICKTILTARKRT